MWKHALLWHAARDGHRKFFTRSTNTVQCTKYNKNKAKVEQRLNILLNLCHPRIYNNMHYQINYTHEIAHLDCLLTYSRKRRFLIESGIQEFIFRFKMVISWIQKIIDTIASKFFRIWGRLSKTSGKIRCKWLWLSLCNWNSIAAWVTLSSFLESREKKNKHSRWFSRTDWMYACNAVLEFCSNFCDPVLNNTYYNLSAS